MGIQGHYCVHSVAVPRLGMSGLYPSTLPSLGSYLRNIKSEAMEHELKGSLIRTPQHPAKVVALDPTVRAEKAQCGVD